MSEINPATIKIKFSMTYNLIRVTLKNIKNVDNILNTLNSVLETYKEIREFIISDLIEKELMDNLEKYEIKRENKLNELLKNDKISEYIYQFRKIRQLLIKNEFETINLFRKHFTIIFKDDHNEKFEFTQKKLEFVYNDLEDFYKLVQELIELDYNLKTIEAENLE